MGFGRFICVGLPFALTLASLVCILIVALSGVTNTGLYMFEVNTGNLSISTTDLSGLQTRDLSSPFLSTRGLSLKLSDDPFSDATSGAASVNITAADLGLHDSYTVSLWSYCYTQSGTKTCAHAAFDWAANATNITSTLTTLAADNGASFTDKTLINAVKTIATLIKWTEIVYIIAGALAVIELIIGLFAFCSRIGSCCTFLISGFSTLAIIAAASLSTILSALVVGTISALKKFGLSASFNTGFLALSWLAVVFSLAGSLFWLFTICCCAPDRKERRDKHRSRAGDEKPYGGYQRVQDPFLPVSNHHAYAGQELGYIPPTTTTVPVNAQRYEPYSHASV